MTVVDNLATIRKNIHVKDIMSKDVVCLSSKDTVFTAVKTMTKKRISTIIVKDDSVAGVVTRVDIMDKVFEKEKDPKKIFLEEVMSTELKTISPDAPLLKASNMMKIQKIRKLIVMEGDTLKGIITQTDIVKSMNQIYESYKYLLWNPWTAAILFAFITLLFILNKTLFCQ